MRVLMIDDHAMFLQGMRTLLAVLAPELVVDLANGQDDATALAQRESYAVVLLDWNLGSCRGDDMVACLRGVGCAARIVVVSGESEPACIMRMFDHGIAGFIPKTYTGERMLDALHQTIDGRVFVPTEVLAAYGNELSAPIPSVSNLQERIGILTPRQLAVFRAAARGAAEQAHRAGTRGH